MYRSPRLWRVTVMALGCSVALLSLRTAVHADTVIPPDIRYHKASAAINQQAQQILQTALLPTAAKTGASGAKTEASGLLAPVVVCGPLLWDELKAPAQKIHLTGKPMFVMLALPGGRTLRKEGRGFTTPQQVQLFWKTLLAYLKPQLKTHAVRVRQAGLAEIKYFWATIPFDIEEPLLAVDLPQQKLIVNFSLEHQQPKIDWVDVVGDLNTIK